MSRRARLYDPLGWALVRAPALPVESLADLGTETAGDPLVAAALAVASPSLHGQMARDQMARDQASERRARASAGVLRYLIRMSTRATPFGLFAGVGLARLDDATDLALGAFPGTTQARPDMGWLMALVGLLEARPEVRAQLRLLANPAVRIVGGRAQLDESVGADGRVDGGPVTVRASGAVRRALAAAREPVRWSDLAAQLTEELAAAPERVERLLTTLWEQTFLLTELRPPLTGPSPAQHVLERLADVPAAREEHDALAEVVADLAAWDQAPLAERPGRLEVVGERMGALVPAYDRSTVQVDAALDLPRDRIAAAVGDEAARVAELLLRLGPAGDPDPLESMRSAFVARYGADAEVPLLDLLDPETGLDHASGRSHGHVPPQDLARRSAALRRLAVDALRLGRTTVALDEEEMARLSVADPTAGSAPVSLDLSVFVLAASAADVDAGRFRLMPGPNLGAQEAGRNLGRFAGLLGEPALAAVHDLAAAEARAAPGVVHAELVFLPRDRRSANVAIRPTGHPLEIVSGTTPGGPAAPLSELVVGVDDGRFVVRWPGVPGELVVHAGHMLTHRQAPAAARFLLDVARGRRRSLTPWSWESVGDLPFLPRVEAGRVVLAPAQWRLDEVAWPGGGRDAGSGLSAWREAWQVPRHVYVATGDNRLLLDLEADDQVSLLRTELRRLGPGQTVVLHEALPGPEHAWLRGPAGGHLPEVVVPLVQRRPAPSRPQTLLRGTAYTSAERLRLPGSDWLYLRLQAPRARHDELIAGPVRGFAELALGAGLADRWHFLRYADPEPQLRLRFHGDPGTLVGKLLLEACGWVDGLVAEGVCGGLAIDTYQREVERYGGREGLAVAEEVFDVDSTTAADLLDLEQRGAIALDRLELAVLSIDDLLIGLGLDDTARLRFCESVVVSRQATGQDYRRRKTSLRALLGDASGLTPELTAVLRARRQALEPMASRFSELEAAGELVAPLQRVRASLVHMHHNRLVGLAAPAEQDVLGLLLRTRDGLLRAPLDAEYPSAGPA